MTEQFSVKLLHGYTLLQNVFTLDYQHSQRQLIFEIGKVKLYHYQKTSSEIHHGPPILLVFATVNRPEILDLYKEQSFIRGLLDAGMNVYLLDWGYADKGDGDVHFRDYITIYLHACVQCILEKNQSSSLNLVGICQGGLISLCYAAHFQNIHKLILISTPIDFHTHDNLIAQLLKHIDIDVFARESLISGAWLTQFFISLRPFELLGKKYLHYIDHLENKKFVEKFLLMEKWIFDSPHQPRLAFCEFIQEFYRDNNLIKNNFYIDQHKIDLTKFSLPILNIMASEDTIIPMSASKALRAYIDKKNYQEKIFPSGHIGIYVSDKVGKKLLHTITAWLKEDV